MSLAGGALDLGRRRGFGETLSTAVAVFRAHAAVFLSLTFLVVAPVVIVIDGILGRQLAEGVDADPSQAVSAASAAAQSLLVPALVTALHATVVLGLGRGEEPAVGGALRAAASRLLPALGAILLYAVAVTVGLLALIVPGIYIAIRCYFAAQAAVLEGRGPAGALRRSAELTRGEWWRCLGYLLGSGLVFGLLGTVVFAFAAAAAGTNGAVYVTLEILIFSVTLSLTALFGTLLYFDLRSREDDAPAPSSSLSTAPERP